MKKIVTIAAILGVIGFASYHAASAHDGFYNNGYGYCNRYITDGAALTKEDAEAIEKFQTETSATRKELIVKRSELNALLSKDNPDETKVAKLTSDLYDLETDLGSKAQAAGIDNRFAYGMGPGMMRGYGYGPGMMQGYGPGYGRHMMGW